MANVGKIYNLSMRNRIVYTCYYNGEIASE